MAIDEAFLHRLETAFDAAPGVPEQKHGRIAWLMREIGRANNGDQPTFESVRRWFTGRSKPSGRNIDALCKVLNVDPAWLAFGTQPSGTRADQVRSSSRADGAVYYVLGAMLLEGMSAGMPREGDELAVMANIDIEAIIAQQSRRFTVSSAEKGADGGYVARPRMPSLSNDHIIVIPSASGRHEMIHLTPAQVKSVVDQYPDYAEIRFLTATAGSVSIVRQDDGEGDIKVKYLPNFAAI
jgi:hypothetical protein